MSLTLALLNTGGLSPVMAATQGVQTASGATTTSPTATPDVEEIVVTAGSRYVDQRVRIRALPGMEEQVYGPNEPITNMLAMLYRTDGVVFPYTPTISVDQSVNYRDIELVHSNYDINAYTRTPSVSISVSGKFTVQNQFEGRYLLSVLHFFRVVSKMNFGETDPNAGLPPPVLRFSGYGNNMFHDLRCVIKSHNYTLDDSVDYIEVDYMGKYTRLPAILTLSVTLGVQQTPGKMRKEFNLEEFRTGDLMTKPGWF